MSHQFTILVSTLFLQNGEIKIWLRNAFFVQQTCFTSSLTFIEGCTTTPLFAEMPLHSYRWCSVMCKYNCIDCKESAVVNNFMKIIWTVYKHPENSSEAPLPSVCNLLQLKHNTKEMPVMICKNFHRQFCLACKFVCKARRYEAKTWSM